MRTTLALCGTLILFLFSSFSQAAHWNLAYRICPEELVRIPEFMAEPPIPVGCEVIDCCPGCPGPGPLDWLINVDGRLFSGADLRIEGMPAEQIRALTISGEAKFNGKNGFRLGTGEIRIGQLPLNVNGRIPVAYLEPQVRDQVPEANPNDDGDRSATLQIRQLLGPFVVNRFDSRFTLKLCRNRLEQDRLKVENNTGGDSVVAMVDARYESGCVNDDIVRTTASAWMGNVLSNDSCNSEVSVFSDDNAMSFQPDVTTWTDLAGDVHTVELQPIITVPVSVWVADDDEDAMDRANDDFANATVLYNDNNICVQFDPTITDVSANAAAVTAIGTNCPNAANVGALQASAWYTAGRLNIYYADRAFTGVNCNSDQNISYVGTTANLGTLPHEIGHAYGLRTQAANWGHSNGLAGFGNDNIMWGGGPATRDRFSVGQAFRINTHDTSQLNVNGDRAGATRDCETNVSDNLCPDYALDALPH